MSKFVRDLQERHGVVEEIHFGANVNLSACETALRWNQAITGVRSLSFATLAYSAPVSNIIMLFRKTLKSLAFAYMPSIDTVDLVIAISKERQYEGLDDIDLERISFDHCGIPTMSVLAPHLVRIPEVYLRYCTLQSSVGGMFSHAVVAAKREGQINYLDVTGSGLEDGSLDDTCMWRDIEVVGIKVNTVRGFQLDEEDEWEEKEVPGGAMIAAVRLLFQ